MHAFLSYVGTFLGGCVVGAVVWGIYKARAVAKLIAEYQALKSKLP